MAAMRSEDIVLNRIFGQGVSVPEADRTTKQRQKKKIKQKDLSYSPQKSRKIVNKANQQDTKYQSKQKHTARKPQQPNNFYDIALDIAKRKGMAWPEVIKRTGFYKAKLHMMRKNKIRPDLGDLLTLCIVLDMSKSEAIKYLRTAGYILSNEYVTDIAYAELLDMQPRLSIPECNDYLAQAGITKKDFLGNKKRNSQTNIFDTGI